MTLILNFVTVGWRFKRCRGTRAGNAAGVILADLMMNCVAILSLLCFVLLEQTKAVEGLLEKGKEIHLIIALDLSASMTAGKNSLEKAIDKATINFPLVRTFKVGIVVFQRGEYYEFPLQEIAVRNKDGGVSYGELKSFIEGFTVQTGLVEVGEATKHAAAMLEGHASENTREIIAVLSDVSNGDVKGIDASANDEWINFVDTWLHGPNTDRRFLSLFALSKHVGKPGYDAAAHRKVYERLGELDGGIFEDEGSALFTVLFESSFDRYKPPTKGGK